MLKDKLQRLFQEFDAQAYAYGFLSVFAQGGYLTLVQRSSMETKRSTIEMIHINGFNTLPFFTVVSMCIQEPIKIANSTSFQGFLTLALLFISCQSILNQTFQNLDLYLLLFCLFYLDAF